MQAFLYVLLLSSLLSAEVTLRTVRTSGGDYPATLAGLQSAVDYCRTLDTYDPCIVEVEAGTEISGAGCYLLLNPQTPKIKLIYVRSSRIRELPEGVRVTAADAAKLWKLKNDCASSQGVIVAPPETSGVLGAGVSSHYIIQGCEVHYSGEGRNSGGAVNIGYDPGTGIKARAFWQFPHTIIVDRCWAHGNDTQTWITASSTHANQNGIRVDGRNLTIKNSRISDNNMDGVDHGQGESRGIAGSNAQGPLYVLNNYIDGAIGSILGGEEPWVHGLVFTGAWFHGNEYTRDPWAWHWEEWDTTDTLNTSEPCITNSFWQQKVSPLNKWKCVGGTWQPSSDNRVNRGWAKNAWECKSCRMVTVEGNYIHDIPAIGDQQQVGYAMLINHVDAFFNAFYARPEYIDIRFNRSARVGQGPTLSWAGITTAFARTNNIAIEHNLFESVGGPRVSPTQGTVYNNGGGTQLQISGVGENLHFASNTFIYDRTFAGAGIKLGENPPLVHNIYMQDNLMYWGSVGQTPLDGFNEACSAITTLFRGAAYWNYFGLVDSNNRGLSAFNSIYNDSACPANKSRLATYADVKFVSYNNGENGDYRLCTAPGVPHASCTDASPWATSSSKGGALGADVQQVTYASSGAATGVLDAAFPEFKITRKDSTEIRYTAYDANACTGTIKTESGSLEDSWTDGGGVALSRTHAPDMLTAGAYVVRVTCAGRWREESLRVY
jgi:hypothetical protein